MGAKEEGINLLLNLFSSILEGEKSGAGFATLVSLHPSLVTPASLLSVVVGKHLQHLLTSCPGCSLLCTSFGAKH